MLMNGYFRTYVAIYGTPRLNLQPLDYFITSMSSVAEHISTCDICEQINQCVKNLIIISSFIIQN